MLISPISSTHLLQNYCVKLYRISCTHYHDKMINMFFFLRAPSYNDAINCMLLLLQIVQKQMQVECPILDNELKVSHRNAIRV